MALRWGGEIFHTLLESYRRTDYCLTNRAGSGAGTAGQARLIWLRPATPIVMMSFANAVAGVAPGEASASLKKSKAALSFVQYVLNIVHSLL